VRFTCGNCGRVYVADDRIAGRAFRMRCKRCGHAISVRPEPSPAPAPSAWEGEVAFGELSREMGDSFEEVAPGPRPATEPAPPPEIEAPPEAEEPATGTPAAEELRPVPGRRRVGLAVVAGIAVVAAAFAGIRFLAAPAGRDVPASVAVAEAGPARVEPPPQATAIPPQVSPPAEAAPVVKTPVATPETAPPTAAPAPAQKAARKEPATRAPAPVTAAAPAKPAAPPAAAVLPTAPPRADLPPRDEQELQSMLARYAAAFEGCVAEARRDDPALLASPRRAVLTMTVRPNGKAVYPTLDDAQLSNTALGACIKRQAGTFVFPESGGEPVRVRMPLLLGG
jgi:DNA-directed RNA polymerase subunit RPC12/RpoP